MPQSLRPQGTGAVSPRNALASALLALALLPPAAVEVAAQSVAVSAISSATRFPGGLPIADLSEDEAILHALNRLAFGPRPGDLERVRQMGLERWIRQQLDPESLPDDPVSRRLEPLTTLRMSPAELLERYPSPQAAARRAGLSRDAVQQQAEARQELREELEALRERVEGMGGMPDAETRRRLRELRQGMDGESMGGGPQTIQMELVQAKLIRAIESERQLAEVLTDFWFNHFNVNAAKGPTRWLVTSYERDVIRPNVLGRFRTLVGATARSPAMLFYLDNWLSAGPQTEVNNRELQTLYARALYDEGLEPNGVVVDILKNRGVDTTELERRIKRQQKYLARYWGKYPRGRPTELGGVGPRRAGLNENYARELLELHTLGVEGGYTQADIVEVARAFTGWTLRAPRQDPGFLFDARLHAPGVKTILGRSIRGGGQAEGDAVLDLLASHPATASFIATKLARRFVADDPPEALVRRMARRFLDTDGDLRAVVEAMVYAPEFWAREVFRAKVKRPFELVASTARALGADVLVAMPLVQWTARMGESLYLCEPPTGYPDLAEGWVGSGALLHRLNFALEIAEGRTRGVRVREPAELRGGADPLDAALARFVGGQVSAGTRKALEERMGSDAGMRPNTIVGLVLGAPEFQRR